MIDLGDFSTYAKTVEAAEGDEEPVRSFDWFGSKIRLRDHVAPMKFASFYTAMRDRKIGPAEMRDVLVSTIHPEDFSTFSDLADDNDVDGAGLLAVINKILEAFAARPTKQPSTSSDGSPTTSPTSTPDSEPKEQAQPSTEERVAEFLGVPLPPESRPDARAALRLVDEPIPEVA